MEELLSILFQKYALTTAVILIKIIGQFRSWTEEYGSTCRFWVANLIPYVLTCDVHVIEKILSSPKYIEKGKYDYSLLLDWLGTGFLIAPGKKWFGRRKLIVPSFHFKILEDFIPIFNEQASIFIKCLENRPDDKQSIFNMSPYISKCTLDIICETAMGKKINAQTSTSNKRYFDALNGMTTLMLDKLLKPWLRIPILYNLTSRYRNEKRHLAILKGFTDEVLQTRKLNAGKNVTEIETDRLDAKAETMGVYGRQRKAFLDLLLDVADETQQLNDVDIQEEVETFMFEGQDTMGTSLGWTILLLGMDPERQRLVQSELDEIFADDPTRDVTSMDISKMKYLECCLKESLRLFPSVPFIMRQIETDLRLDDGRIIPKGATVMMGICLVHRVAEHFPEPDKFIPERWSTESTTLTKRHPYAYVPFSAGPRNCIGQKYALLTEKIVLAKLFRQYTIETREKLEDLKMCPDVVLRCENGVHVTMRKR